MKKLALLSLLSICFLSFCTNKNESDALKESIKETVFLRFFIEDSAKNKATAIHFLDQLASKKITAYEDDNTSRAVDFVQFMKDQTYTDTLISMSQKEDLKIDTTYKTSTFTPDKIVGYKIKSVLTQDKNGKFSFKYSAIAPLTDIYSDGSPIGQVSLFWLKYEDFGN